MGNLSVFAVTLPGEPTSFLREQAIVIRYSKRSQNPSIVNCKGEYNTKAESEKIDWEVA